MANSTRIIGTPSQFARSHYLYVQEVGSLESKEPHVSKRTNLASYLFVIVTKGSGIFNVGGNDIAVSLGDCLFIDCSSPYYHKSSTEDPWSLMWVHFLGASAECYYKTFRDLNEREAFTPSSVLPFAECIRDIYEEMETQGPLYELSCNRLLTDLTELACMSVAKNDLGGEAVSEKLDMVRKYISKNCDLPITLEDLESRFFISRFHLSREYKKRFGITIGNDLTQKRITKAKFMLRNSKNGVEQISRECGFKDVGYFVKVFKKSEGMTPLAFRKSWLESQM